MKKLFTLALFGALSSTAFCQTVQNAGFETWHNNTSGSAPTVNIQVPDEWFGLDSLIIATGEFAHSVGLGGAGTDWHGQLSEATMAESNSGNHAAKMVTVKQDTLGTIAGIMTNVNVTIDLTALQNAASDSDLTGVFSYSGGTVVSQKIGTVSAYVKYTSPGTDTAQMLVMAVKQINGIDSIIGTGNAMILPVNSYVPVTANVTYTDNVTVPDTIRIIFLSSAGLLSGGGRGLVGSLLFVDDVSMGIYTGVANTPMQNDVLAVYPNPCASRNLHLSGPTGVQLQWHAFSMTGQEVASQAVNGHTVINTTNMAAGLYTYSVTDVAGNIVQRGKVTLNK